ncbi:F-box protein At5g51370-like [Andrographis paniculata]|uniref:F-box protein At5g51370-like n=1 Tax=Andrographis paniculata TaxID=175694 RepID=UPI0021E807A4|nr:F-box protein At5g51370-like [Andrographis paniculata]XP_051129996.1 F-box protein At5g51370-like [Andrographis paniculata]
MLSPSAGKSISASNLDSGEETRDKHHPGWPDPFPRRRVDPEEALKHAILMARRHRPVSHSGSTTPYSESETDSSDAANPSAASLDCTSSLSDELLLRVFGKLPDARQHISNSLVCRRWCALCGKLLRSIRLLDWEFLESGRLSYRFPNLIEIDLVRACVKSERNLGTLLSNKLVEIRLTSGLLENEGFFVRNEDMIDSIRIDEGVRILAEGCKNLRKVSLMNVGEEGLGYLGKECELLQEMELHYCNDSALKSIGSFRNLQILKLIPSIPAIYASVVSDIGMTFLAQGCRRLVKLELVGCDGSYDGIKAIGQCCPMLEELSVISHRMEGGWLSGLSYCTNLKTLRIESCANIDVSPGPVEHLGSCAMLEELWLQRCLMRDEKGVSALFSVCRDVKELVVEDCWGLDDSVFAAAAVFRAIRSLSLEGCSLLSTQGLESVIQSWKDLERLRVVSCNNIKDSEMTADLATLFSVLKELKWRPDSRSLLSASLAGTGIRQKGGRSLRSK